MSKRVVIGSACLLVAAGVAFGFVSYAQSEADKRDALSAQFIADTEAAAKRAEEEQDTAVESALTQQKKRYTRLIKRMRTKAERDAKKAFERGRNEGYSSGTAVGYSSGTADGYASGAADGFDDGLTEGSDELTCSDDPDIYWLPACLF